jgi:hypothetical protein
MIDLWVILTIGCLPIDEQVHLKENPTATPCVIETQITEYAVGPGKPREEIEALLTELGTALQTDIPGSFTIARVEERKRPEPKEEKE